MENVFKIAKKYEQEIIENRRFLHAHAETGFALTQTVAFVKQKLQEMGYTPQDCGKSGVVATIGKSDGRGAFLLRADMDALPIREKTGLTFACKTGAMHACGHDMHTAMLLGAARILKENERKLTGQIKLLFQPAEEKLEGAKNMIEAGVLTAPRVRGAAMLHVLTNIPLSCGTLVVSSAGVTAPAADYFSVEVQGKACHGSSPQNGVDALLCAAHIVLALQGISAREISVASPAVLTVGKLSAGVAGNAIADFASMQGTLRAFDEDVRAQVKKRLQEISLGIAKSFRAKANVRFESGCPSLLNDKEVSKNAERALRQLLGEKSVFTSAELGGGVAQRNGGSEDFAYISREVPSVMIALAAGNSDEGYAYPLHHPKVQFDERALVVGAAAYACVGMAN